VPVGTLHAHGPIPIGIDARSVEKLADEVGRRTGLMVLPVLAYGENDKMKHYPGTITIDQHLIEAVYADICRSLRRNGVRKVIFLNGHGGNIATVTASFSEIYAERSMQRMSNQPPLKCVLRNWWESNGVTSLRRELYGGSEGSHATPSEVALTWYRFPETMQQKPMEPRVAPNGSFTDAEHYRRTFPDGRIGSDPNLATPEHGKRIYETAVEDVARDYEAWVAR